MDKRFLDIAFQKLARNASQIDLKLRALPCVDPMQSRTAASGKEFDRKMKGKPFFGLRRE
jgi:hypothetical protein